ncbi:MAG: hypothetical protein L3J91_06615 [Thermoplasmata archaeon]|nr:hypothetical protein [Thermoplasmata archaeon]
MLHIEPVVERLLERLLPEGSSLGAIEERVEEAQSLGVGRRGQHPELPRDGQEHPAVV